MNTMTPLFIKEYNEVLDKVAADQEIRVVILRAEGKAFCAGEILNY